jgi:hypothetical protein
MAISAFLFSAMLEASGGNLRSLIAGDPSPAEVIFEYVRGEPRCPKDCYFNSRRDQCLYRRGFGTGLCATTTTTTTTTATTTIDADSVHIEAPDPWTFDQGIIGCEVSAEDEKCKCETEERSTECDSYKLCDFDTGRCNPDCTRNISNRKCKCGRDPQGDVLCKSPELCRIVRNRSDMGGHIASCDA